jgi:uncharacterized membrane protein YhaH (DUF805 family)
MTFVESITTCLKDKYVDLNGRASRSEYWWFVLFNFASQIVISIVSSMLAGLVALGLLLPAVAVGARRLHDIGKSGWWMLIGIIPILGWLILIYWYVQPTAEGSNEYGEPPAATPTE